jgi:ABC-type transport system involved in multi-copper enzyme maturation permease subunit
MIALNVMLADLRKLRRRNLLIGSFGVIFVLATLFDYLIFAKGRSHVKAHTAIKVVSSMSGSDGGYYGFTLITFFIGLIGLAVAAANLSQEYSLATLKNSLVRVPDRRHLLIGKLLASALFASAMTLLTALYSYGLSLVLAASFGISTKLWFSGKALSAFIKLIFFAVAGAIAYAGVGAGVGLILKSPISSIAISLLWFLVVESIFGSMMPGVGKWLPGQALANLSMGGNHDFPISRAVVMSVGYLIVIIGAASWRFLGEDVTV